MKESIRAGVLLAVMLGMLFLPGFLSGSGDLLGGPGQDGSYSYLPWRTLGFASLLAGRIPFWNPHVLCGTPFAANPETALFYPLNWLLLPFSPARGISLSLVLHLWLAGFFTFLMLRHLGCSFWPSQAGGLVFLGCTQVLFRVFAGHVSNLCTMAWLPAQVLLIEHLAVAVTPRTVALASLVFCLSVLGGHFQFVIFFFLFLALYAWLRFRQGGGLLGRSGAWAAGLALGTGLSSIQWSLTWELLREGARRDLSLAFCQTYSWDPAYVWSFLFPDYLLIWPDLGTWGNWLPWMMVVYIGILPLLLAALAVGRGLFPPRILPGDPPVDLLTPASRAFSICGGAMFFLAMGSHTGIFPWLYAHVPGVSMFRAFCQFLIPGFLCLAALAGLGGERLLRAGQAGRRGEVLCILGIGGMLVAAGAFQVFRLTANQAEGWAAMTRANIQGTANIAIPPGITDPRHRSTVIGHFQAQLGRLGLFTVLALGGALLVWRRPTLASVLVVITFLDLFSAGSKYLVWQRTQDQFPPSIAGESGQDAKGMFRKGIDPYLASPNAALLEGSFTPLGYESNPPYLIAALAAVLTKASVGENPTVVTIPFEPFAAGLLAMKAALTREGTIPFPDSPPRARFVDRVTTAGSLEEVWNAIRERRPPFPNGVMIVASSPVPGAASAPVEEPSPGPGEPVVTWLEQETDRLCFTVASPREGWFFLADTFARGWSATVDGAAVPIFQANGAFRAIPIAAGTHRVVFSYDPPGLRRGIWGTGLSLITVTLLLVVPGRERLAPSAAGRPS